MFSRFKFYFIFLRSTNRSKLIMSSMNTLDFDKKFLEGELINIDFAKHGPPSRKILSISNPEQVFIFAFTLIGDFHFDQ